MSTVRDEIKELHEVLGELIDTRDQARRLPLQLQAKQRELDKHEQRLNDHREANKRLRMEIHSQEVSLRAAETRRDDLKIKLNMTKSTKEFTALQDEIKMLTERGSGFESGILDLMSQQEAAAAALVDEEKAVQTEREEFAKFRETVAYKQKKLADRTAYLETKLAECEARLGADARIRYRRNVETRGKAAVAAVENGVCQSCFTELTPQVWSDVNSGRTAVFCPCGSLLYRA